MAAIAALAAGPLRAEPHGAPRSAVSSDGFIRVVAYDDPGDDVGFRLPVLSFAGKTIDAVAQAFDLKRAKYSEPGLVIYAMEGRTNDTRVVVKRETRRDRPAVTKIFLPSPGYSDIDDLRMGVVRAFLGPEPPDWMVQGVLRCIDEDTRRDDQRFVLSLWSNGRLPFFPAICTDLRVGKGPAAALPGYVAGWVRERKLLGTLIGRPWDGKRLAELLTGETDPVLQDRASDEHLARLERSVLEPGKCGVFELDVFSSRLFLKAPTFDVKMCKGRSTCSFAEAIEAGDSNLAVRAVALMKSREVPLYAIGRGEKLAAAAAAYERFLLGVAAGEDGRKLKEMLDVAEARLEVAYEKRRKDDYGKR